MGKDSKQKKVTNAYLAKLLGWKKKKSISFRYWFEPGSGKSYFKPPDFLHSLDATMKECKRLWLYWQVSCGAGGYSAVVLKNWGKSLKLSYEKTAPLALATALARYLESRVA